MRELLVEAHGELGRFVDVEDGDYGVPRPNWAMQFRSQIDATVDAADGFTFPNGPRVQS
jgi:hypothetical protein